MYVLSAIHGSNDDSNALQFECGQLRPTTIGPKRPPVQSAVASAGDVAGTDKSAFCRWPLWIEISHSRLTAFDPELPLVEDSLITDCIQIDWRSLRTGRYPAHFVDAYGLLKDHFT